MRVLVINYRNKHLCVFAASFRNKMNFWVNAGASCAKSGQSQNLGILELVTAYNIHNTTQSLNLGVMKLVTRYNLHFCSESLNWGITSLVTCQYNLIMNEKIILSTLSHIKNHSRRWKIITSNLYGSLPCITWHTHKGAVHNGCMELQHMTNHI